MNQNQHRPMRTVIAFLIASTMAFTPCLTAFAEDTGDTTDLDALRQQQQTYAAQKADNDSKIASLKEDQSQKEAYQQTLLDQKRVVEGQISTSIAQIDALDKQIKDKEAEISDKQTAVSEDISLLKERLYALYVSGEASNMEILLSSQNLNDLSDKIEALQMVTKHDTDLIGRLKGELSDVEAAKQTVESDKQEATNAKTALDERQQELTQLSNEAGQAIQQISSSASSLEDQNAQLAQKEAEASAAIDSWMANYYAQRQTQSQTNNNNTYQSGSGDSNQGSNNTSGNQENSSSSGLNWPAPSAHTITTGFEYRWGAFHNGYDLSGSGVYGTSIVAAASGTIAYVSSGFGDGYYGCRDGGGFGNYVIIDHGNGLSTLYGHMQSVSVSVGQSVSQGQVIGALGTSGSSTGPHLHFTVYKNGTAVDPGNYI
ncbi:MAG: peptidoglycan DD-metalloendopeptidase family protein [Clostridiales bacterium]|jgi:murein DD-endopeptidase MepM/ murein hydrolase activator NlpD|nr:peptidoglycan DD-metalloendopeptidase family protein [Clostridiales bacterium]MCI1961810.1 peptidoglycan DD-metalloendopeptidase family protein [Clostridiales bacterium]MCI2022457.1 peptidoglycan DD-metalloendopeptidase family protein [Clostridiales bacterium]MCI2026854.1 peptidoglycan DD-metalloendopeptidase family protein [Clostridiales bacterium]